MARSLKRTASEWPAGMSAAEFQERFGNGASRTTASSPDDPATKKRERGRERASDQRRAKRAMIPTEHQEQARLFEIAKKHEHLYPCLDLLYAVPNGAGLRHIMTKDGKRISPEANKLYREGMKRGACDVNLDVARQGFHGLRIEMKRRDKKNDKPHQLKWQERLREEGFRVEAAWSAEEAWGIIMEYLGIQ